MKSIKGLQRVTSIAGMVLLAVCLLTAPTYGSAPPPAQTLHLGFESEQELLSDFLSQSAKYRPMGRDGLNERGLAIEEGRFGKALHIRDGWPISKGAWNESGLDCDLIVAVMWGEWHKKAHYWGSGAFHGDSGTVAFWVKTDALNPGIVFMQGNVAWGRMERDLFSIEVDKEGRLSAFIRDVRYDYHRVTADKPTWKNGEWQHIAVVYDRGYGLKLYHNGKVIGSTWGKDAWWQTSHPGLFSPFLPESFYDEIYFFDGPLSDEEIASLYANNSLAASPRAIDLDSGARKRLMAEYGDLDNLELPTLTAGTQELKMKQIEVENCHDDRVPAWWIFDGRYELAWPHPYRLFTFILGDVDYHGTKADIDLAQGEKPNYIAFEGILDGLQLVAGKPNDFEKGKELINLKNYDSFFYSKKIDLEGASALRIPLTKEYGSPPGLEGSANLPLSGLTRIHETHLWRAAAGNRSQSSWPDHFTYYLRPEDGVSGLARYGSALRKIMGGRDRTVVSSSTAFPSPARVPFDPLSSVTVVSSDLIPDTAVDSIGLQLFVAPTQKTDSLWIKLHDPANPSRIWAQTCIKVNFQELNTPQPITFVMDIIDLMLASGDRLLLEIVSANGGELILGDSKEPSALFVFPSQDREKSLAAYAKHELHPARMQYSKEYNYKPWQFIEEKVNIENWSSFGGPYDMAYPPMAVLRHDPSNRIAGVYHTLTVERNRPQPVPPEALRNPMPLNVPPNAPSWAVWEWELLKLNRRVAHWIANWQQPNGMFWGGPNDDSFLPLGYAALPLMGDEITRKSWLKFYDGLEKLGIFADGYCDIWPIDPLHITDFITSRGLMLAFAPGDPQVFDRELRTSERYTGRVAATDKRLTQQGAPPLSGERTDRDRKDVTLVECMEAQIRNYSRTHVRWYWGQTEKPEPHILKDREGLARQMMNWVHQLDENSVFGFTEAMIHTDTQGAGLGRNELIAAALGGGLQGRIEPRPHSIAVSWEDNDSDRLTRLVSYADDKSLSVNLYNFGYEPETVTMRVWRLSKGRYEIRFGADENDDGVLDEANGNVEQAVLGRFSTIPIQVPPRKGMVVTVTQIDALPEVDALPDLAVTHRDLRITGDNALEVTVHNIGAAHARNIGVDLVDAKGGVVATQTIEEIETPIHDFAARKKTLVFQGLTNPSELGVRVDAKNTIEEIFEENNSVAAQ
ncbi:MAG: LamG-like jellyroll fold domain-containing protein [bacterium]